MRAIVANCRFAGAQLVSQQPFGAISVAVTAMALLVSATFYLGLAAQQSEQIKQLGQKRNEFRQLVTRAATDEPMVPSRVRPALSVFQSAEFARQFQTAATEAGLAIDEVAYVLDSPQGQPYLRYRLSLTVKTRYTEIWNFAAFLESSLPDTLLDSVRCRRENAAASQLTCDLAFSALFAKA